MAKKKPAGAWIDELMEGVGHVYVNLETSHGVVRSGKLSGLRNREITWNGEKLQLPIEVELNNDPTDTVPLHLVQKITIDS